MAKLKPRLEGKGTSKKINPDGSVTYTRQYAGEVGSPPIDAGIVLPGNDTEFQAAFAAAREAGKPEFTHTDGKTYSTDVAPRAKSIEEEMVSTVPVPLEGKGIPEQTASVEPAAVTKLAPRPNPLHELIDFRWEANTRKPSNKGSTMTMQESGHLNPKAANQRDYLRDIFDRMATPEDLSTEEGTKKLISKANTEFRKTYTPPEGEEKYNPTTFRGGLQFTGRGLK